MALVTKNFTLNVTPGAMPPTIHVSEYDVGRAYNVTFIGENGNAFEIPTGTTATVEGTLNGTIGFTTSATVRNNQVSFTLSESMTAYSGKAWCKIKLTQNSQPIQTCAFVLAVDRAGVEADTVIGAPGFEEQIQEAVNDYLDEHGTGGDADALKQMLYLMLIPILKEGLYGTDQTNAIAALETALGAVPVVTKTVTNNLTNVTTSNDATIVVKGTTYTATLTPVGDAVIQTVTVTMGGVDVTSTVYLNGTINIPSVTGNVVITAIAESMIETIAAELTVGYINPADGNASTSSSYKHTQSVTVAEGDKVYGECTDSQTGNHVNLIQVRFIAAYDANGDINASAGMNDMTNYTQSSPFTVPSGVRSIILSLPVRYANDVTLYVDKTGRVGA